MSSFNEASKIIFVKSLREYGDNWVFTIDPRELLEVVEKWREDPPLKNVLDDFKYHLNKKKQGVSSLYYGLDKFLCDYEDGILSEDKLDNLLDNLFYFGLNPDLNMNAFQNSEKAINFIDHRLCYIVERYY